MVKSALVLAALGAGAAGCIDARGNFDQFADRVGFTDASTMDRPPSQIYDVSGTFLYSVRAGFETSNDPDYYIQFLLRSELTMTGDTAVFTGTLTPLCTFSTCTSRDEIPPSLDASNVPVTAQGTFSATFGGTLPSLGNPFSGSPQALNTIASGTLMSADFFCGEVAGDSAGIDLVGSTFAAVRVADANPANFPEPIAACPSTTTDAGVDAPMLDAPVDAGTDASPDA